MRSVDVEVVRFGLNALLGMFCSAVGSDAVPASELPAWYLEKSRQYWRALPSAPDYDTARSLVIGAEVLEGVASTRPSSEILESCLSALEGDSVFGWLCPDCSDLEKKTRLDYVGGGEWVCPSCGCHTVSPLDDACVPVWGDFDE